LAAFFSQGLYQGTAARDTGDDMVMRGKLMMRRVPRQAPSEGPRRVSEVQRDTEEIHGDRRRTLRPALRAAQPLDLRAPWPICRTERGRRETAAVR
jgi:hypothetical protein